MAKTQNPILEQYPALADLWARTTGMSVLDYANLIATSTSSGSESELTQQISSQMFGPELGQDFLAIPWLQTAPHVGFTLSDRMLTIVWLSHLATPGDGPLFIGACSGVPVSIYSKPGYVLGQGLGASNLIPARYQNALVASASSDIVDTGRAPSPQTQKLLKQTRQDNLADWMNAVVSIQLTAWLGREVVVFSLTEWARLILLELIRAGDQAVMRLLATDMDRALFLSTRQSGKYHKLDTWRSDGGQLLSGTGISLSPAQALARIESGELHPASWLMYAMVARTVGLAVAGSFSFASYYPGYQTDWEQIASIPKRTEHCIVTTGTHPDLKGQSSWDIWQSNRRARDLDQNLAMHTLLETIL